jgi:integrase
MALRYKLHRNFTPFNEAGKREKPAKLTPDFPLFPHASGVWAKKIRGKLHYFGPWADPEGALQKYLAERDALHAGKKPKPEPGTVTVKELCNAFLNHKQALLDNGELGPRMFADYREAAGFVVTQFGKQRPVADLGPGDFAALRDTLAKRYGPVRLGNTVQRIRSLFKFGLDDLLLDRPVPFGRQFARPSKKVLRLHRAGRGPNLFTTEEIHRLLAAAHPQLKAMLLLAINCGFGVADSGRLPVAALDLDGGWSNFPRPKTGVARRSPLWPETVAAIREALAVRPPPKDPAHAALVFLGRQGRPYHLDTQRSPLSVTVGQLLRKLKINGRARLGLYTLRHNFETVGGEAKDQPALDHLMGHARDDMASVYRERISDDRLRAVSEHVRAWLYKTEQVG